MSYEHPTKICILIEGVPNTKTLWNVLVKRNIHFYEHDLIPVLFQVYFTLHKIKDQFTHYDLHYDNVLLTELPNYYFNYTVNVGNNLYNIQCKYMIKIIDYGRSYCSESPNIIKELCRNVPQLQNKRLCNKYSYDTSALSGYYWGIRNPLNPYNLITVLCNKSADLRLLYEVFTYINAIDMFDYPKGLRYYHKKLAYKSKNGTPELQNGYPAMINTVTDAFYMLLYLINRHIHMYRMNGSGLIPVNIDL